MQIELKRSALDFIDYYNSDEDFLTLLRMNFDWDDTQFKKLKELLSNVLNDYKDDQVVPKSILVFFTIDIKLITGIVKNPIFYRSPPLNLSEEEFREFVDNRLKELNEIGKSFCKIS